jgi:hypothetical protein
VSGTETTDANKWTYGVRVISNQIDRARWRNTLTYRFHPRATAGIEYNPLAGKVSPLFNVVAVTEQRRRPALIVARVPTESARLTVNLSMRPSAKICGAKRNSPLRLTSASLTARLKTARGSSAA